MVELNDFEKMCMDLDNKKCSSNCKRNKYVCAKSEVSCYVSGNKNKLLSLKSEAQGGDFIGFSSLVLSTTAVLLSMCAIIFSLTCSPPYNITGKILDGELMIDANPAQDYSVVVPVFFILFIFCIMWHPLKKMMAVYAWRKYILVAVEEEEKEMEAEKRI